MKNRAKLEPHTIFRDNHFTSYFPSLLQYLKIAKK